MAVASLHLGCDGLPLLNAVNLHINPFIEEAHQTMDLGCVRKAGIVSPGDVPAVR